MAQQLTNQISIHEDVGLIPGLAQWLRIWHCHELWYRSQTWLGSCTAVAEVQACDYSYNLTPSLGTSIGHGCIPKKKKKKERE